MQYLEPRTDVPAKEDWSTGLIMQDSRWGGRTLGIAAVVATVVWLVCWFLPDSIGTLYAMFVMVPIAFIGYVSLLIA